MRTIHTDSGDLPEKPRQGASTLGIWLGAWAIVIGLVCLYVALDARNVAKDAERRLERTAELLEESRANLEQLETSVRENLELGEQRIREIAFTVEKNESRLRTNTEQLVSTRQVASQLIDNLAGQKEALTELATRIPAIPADARTERTAPPPPAAPRGESRSASQPAAERPAPAPRPTYTVKSGDTLVDIARRKNLSVPDLLDANPDIDPNVIRVGQKLNLPE